MRRALDWEGMLRAGVQGLCLAPEVFWRLTPSELHLMLGGDAGLLAPLTKARLDELVAAFPDLGTGRKDAE